MMTPSEAHDTAWQRDPSHDQMTVDCCLALAQTHQVLNWKRRYSDKTQEYSLKFVGMEQFCVLERGPPFFADILLRWDHAEKSPSGGQNISSVFAAYEVKPKIYSAGAVVRQARVMNERLRAWSPDSDGTFVEIIAQADDPLIPLTVLIYDRPILIWDGSILKRIGGAALSDVPWRRR